MHLGHRLLLSQAALITSKRLLIGVTGDALLKKKQYAELIEPFEERKHSVINFLKLFAPYLEVDIFELNDPVGRAGTDLEIEAVVLTREVEKGGKMIND
jgi:pantetheine-phosphate adenylyltransferase